MRTTLTLDDDLAAALKEASYRSGKTFKAAVNDTLRAGLAALATPAKSKKFRVKPSSLGSLRPGINLDKALQLADTIEDEGVANKLELRK